MKKIIMFFVSFLITVQCYGITEYKVGDKLFVWAKSGLNLRESPDPKSGIITKIHFGKSVECLGRKNSHQYDEDSEKITETVVTSTGNTSKITFNGRWVLVRCGRHEGYVFDAYLSKLDPLYPLPDSINVMNYFTVLCDSYHYLAKMDRNLEYGEEKIAFNNGAYMAFYYSSGGYSFQLVLPEFSMEEAFLLVRYLDNYSTRITYDNAHSIIIEQEMGAYHIESFKNIIIIHGAWSC